MRIYKTKWNQLFVTILILIVISCTTPINDYHLLQIKDKSGPVITIIQPKDGSSYANVVVVEGFVTDASSDTGDTGGLSILYYEVLGKV